MSVQIRQLKSGNLEVDGILWSLERLSQEYQITENREILHDWLVSVIERIRALPEPFQTKMHLGLFLIGDSHYTCKAEKVVEISKTLVGELHKVLGQYVYNGKD